MPSNDGMALVHILTDIIFEDEEGQVRRERSEEEFKSLFDSILQYGQLEPALVYDRGDGTYGLIAGHGRKEVMEKLQRTLACVVMAKPKDRADAIIKQLTSNVIRESLNPMDVGYSIRELMELRGLDQAGAAKTLSLTPTKTSRAVRMTELPPEVIAMVQTRALLPSAAYLCVQIESMEKQIAFAKAACGLTKEKATTLYERSYKKAGKPKPAKLVAKLAGGMAVTLEFPHTATHEAIATTLKELAGKVAKATDVDVDSLSVLFKRARDV